MMFFCMLLGMFFYVCSARALSDACMFTYYHNKGEGYGVMGKDNLSALWL